jgi:hypothetical protein
MHNFEYAIYLRKNKYYKKGKVYIIKKSDEIIKIS